uniref:ATPase family associated with various cellular activities (AAA) n=3 Tax=Candidatus Kentrum eta TaxID=2126337 RepID=A0A450VEZ3_9GAMM|nr:MAG: ATPase family associated with various cellular activities (AAA) [Candidatus Kentron sp. H]
MLPEGIREQIKEVVQEQHRAELLHAHNLCARNRLLFTGPPGNGKTTLAEALAFELMVPLVVVRYETLVGSYLGETSGRLRHLLDYAKTQRCVLFFDEFETLGKERGDTHETGEIKRVVSSLLLQIDALPDYVVLVAASNHPELLDRAVWHRFQVRVELPMPTREQLARHIESIGERHQTDFGYAPEALAEDLHGKNFAEVEEFCLGVVRQAVLHRKTDNAKTLPNGSWRSGGAGWSPWRMIREEINNHGRPPPSFGLFADACDSSAERQRFSSQYRTRKDTFTHFIDDKYFLYYSPLVTGSWQREL